MLIRTEDLDPRVVDAVMGGLKASYAKPNPSEAERQIQQEEMRRFRPSFRPFLPWLGAAVGVQAAALALPFLSGVPFEAVMPAAAVAFWGLLVAGLVKTVRAQQRGHNVLHSDLLAGWLPHIELPPAERAYCETLVLLAKPELEVDDQRARDILVELNRLMGQSRRLDAQQQELGALCAGDSVERIERERDEIAARLSECDDERTRDVLQQSLALCEDRIRNTRALQPSGQRLEAQQELIFQTLASIQAGLARLQSAHQALTEPEVEAIRAQIHSLGSEAEAVEGAVQEVLTLRQG